MIFLIYMIFVNIKLCLLLNTSHLIKTFYFFIKILKEHEKVDKIFTERVKYLEPILKWYNTGNTKAAIIALRG